MPTVNVNLHERWLSTNMKYPIEICLSVKSAMWQEVSNHPTLQSLLIVGFFRKQLYNIIFDEPKIILLNKNLHINTLTLLKKF